MFSGHCLSFILCKKRKNCKHKPYANILNFRKLESADGREIHKYVSAHSPSMCEEP